MVDKAATLEAINKEAMDLEILPSRRFFENMRCNREGLSSPVAQERLTIFGYNKVEKKKGKSPDWKYFVGILTLLAINSTISFIEENNVGNAAAALMARLASKSKILRDGQWSEEDAAVLVPGDIISIKLGDIVHVDARLLEGDPLKIDQILEKPLFFTSFFDNK